MSVRTYNSSPKYWWNNSGWIIQGREFLMLCDWMNDDLRDWVIPIQRPFEDNMNATEIYRPRCYLANMVYPWKEQLPFVHKATSLVIKDGKVTLRSSWQDDAYIVFNGTRISTQAISSQFDWRLTMMVSTDPFPSRTCRDIASAKYLKSWAS